MMSGGGSKTGGTIDKSGDTIKGELQMHAIEKSESLPTIEADGTEDDAMEN